MGCRTSTHTAVTRDTSCRRKYTEHRNSSRLLSGVHIDIFTFKTGIMAQLGHDLKLTCKSFGFFLNSSGDLKLIVCEAASIEVVCPIDENWQPREGKIISEKDRDLINQYTHKDVLAVALYPEICFELTKQTKNEVFGVLTLHGVSNRCKFPVEVSGDSYVCRCPISQPLFGITPFTAMMGALKVAPLVNVEVTIPKTILYRKESGELGLRMAAPDCFGTAIEDSSLHGTGDTTQPRTDDAPQEVSTVTS